ncbi:PREDICTED: uncharacterized protein LOC104798382 isoform X2 [Tarenaya hassleriana]|uniref:uncharacterized protein LOC104798382 isoform X2 n=1 Tax=Tarenaya hassleriana TaxID=28532 RepID=UPI00053C36DC|nr:PREDICTED: uncharacterized protein LOC104798382 isoform X2 [Tarenaya hassleriana]
MGVGGASSKLRKAAKKIVMAACGSFSSAPPLLHPPSSPGSTGTAKPLSQNAPNEKADCRGITVPTSKNLCAICLEALDNSRGEGIFKGQCSHSFHLSCVVANVRHGSVTCPVCRAHWTQLPRNVKLPPTEKDPVFRILDDSIANFRVHRRSARYDDDDPIDPHHRSNHPCLDLSLVPIAPSLVSYPHRAAFQQMGRTAFLTHYLPWPEDGQCLFAFLSVKLTNPQPIDLVLVTSPNGPHLRLLKQAMALVAFSLRPVDRLAIVTCSRVFSLRRMTSSGKRMALQVIDRLFYMGEAEPSEGLRKGSKILEDRTFKNPRCSILHLCDTPARPYYPDNMMQTRVIVHKFHVVSNDFVMREFEEFLGKVLGAIADDIQLRIGEEAKIVKIGRLRGGEERRILLELGGEHVVDVPVGYSFVEGETAECIRRRGETMVSFGDKEDSKIDEFTSFTCGRTSISAQSWDYHDHFMARRWAKRLHGYRF